MARQCRSALDELNFLAPWTALPAVPGKLGDFKIIGEIPTLSELARLDKELLPAISHPRAGGHDTRGNRVAYKLRDSMSEASRRAQERIAAIAGLARQLNELADMESGFLYDKARHLLSIGYNVEEDRRDSGFYDLLASEARLCMFRGHSSGTDAPGVLVRPGPPSHKCGGDPVLLSWGGSMFEYLMPLLVMPTYENTLLDRTYKAAVSGRSSTGSSAGSRGVFRNPDTTWSTSI